MPDVGDEVLALDFTDMRSTTAGADETGFTDTAYAQGGTLVGVAFVAPTSGAVLVLWHARFESNTADVLVNISAAVREGATVGSGTDTSPASDSSAITTTGDASGGIRQRQSAAMFRVVSGLVAGDTYNAVVEHKLASAGNGDIFDRSLAVLPLPL